MKTHLLRPRCSLLALAASLMTPAAALAQGTPAPAPAPAPAQAPPASGDNQREVVVTGTRADVVSTPDRVSFNIANDLQAQTGSVADALRAVPGVEVDLQGNVSLRGDSGVTILIDGRPSAMLRGDSRGDVLLSMPAGSIERVEVITNPGAAMSPEGSGGVINLVRKQARGNANATTRSATIRVNAGPEGRGSLNLSGNQSGNGLTLTSELGYRRMTGESEAVQLRSRLDPASGTFLTSRQDSELDQVSTFANGRLGVEYDLDKKNRLSTELNYREGKIGIERIDAFTGAAPAASFDRVSDIALSQRGLGARASWRRSLSGKDHEFVADAEVEKARLRRAVDAETDFASGASAFEEIRNWGDRDEYNLKLDYKKPVGKEGSINLGYQGNAVEADFASTGLRGPTADTMIPIPGLGNAFEYDQIVHAVFATYRFPLGDLDAQAGLRAEQAETDVFLVTEGTRSGRGYFRVYPTLHLAYDLSKTEQLKANYSRRIQRPSPMDLIPYTFYIDPLNIRRGNPFLLPEVTDSFEAGIQHRKAGTFYSLTGFYRRSRGGVTDIVSDIGGGVFLTTRANLATAERIGAELVANGRLSKTLTYNASATAFWHQIDPRIGGVSMPRSITTGTVRGNLSWQPTPKDFFQANGFYSGRQLLPQGYRESGPVLNLGYRRKVDDRLSLLVTGQNVLDTAKQVSVFETPLLRDRVTQRGTGRVVLFGLSYNVGGQTGKRRPDPAFDFSPGTVDTPQ
jgi:outer membrane receptor protein involved in Fe transport